VNNYLKLRALKNKSMKNLSPTIVFGVMALVMSCAPEEGPEGLQSLINISSEAIGKNCAAGGQKLEIGIDNNRNGILDDDEVETTKFICNGVNGVRALVKVVNELAGANCTTGGVKVMVGTDVNNNNSLETDEVAASQFVCSGPKGETGSASLFRAKEEPAGLNCISGGYMLESGPDKNDNGILDDGEVDMAQYLCNGTSSSDRLVRVSFDFLDYYGDYTNLPNGKIVEDSEVQRFNKLDYPNVESIIFTARIFMDYGTAKGYAELYNLTDNVAIAGSIVETSALEPTYVFSADIKDNLPAKEIKLGIRIKTANSGDYVNINQAQIFIYKN
jgi:hypothetical protein